MKFTPFGDRGYDGASRDANFWFGASKDYVAQANRETFLVARIETQEALDDVDAIAAVLGTTIAVNAGGKYVASPTRRRQVPLENLAVQTTFVWIPNGNRRNRLIPFYDPMALMTKSTERFFPTALIDMNDIV